MSCRSYNEAWVRIPPLPSFLFLNTQYDIVTFSLLINALLYSGYRSLIKNTTKTWMKKHFFEAHLFVRMCLFRYLFCLGNFFWTCSFHTTNGLFEPYFPLTNSSFTLCLSYLHIQIMFILGQICRISEAKI